jgi:hypothetical protein
MCSVFARRFVVVVCLAIALAACGADPSPEDQLKAAIANFVDAVEDGEPRRAGEVLDPSYRDVRHSDKRGAIASLFWYTRQNRDIHVFTVVSDIAIDVASGTARTVVYAAMAGVPVESVETLVSIKADLYRFDVDWRAVDGTWRVVSGRWQRADLSAF